MYLGKGFDGINHHLSFSADFPQLRLLFLCFSLKYMYELHYYYLFYYNKSAIRGKQSSIFTLHPVECKLASLSLYHDRSGIYVRLPWIAPDRMIKYSFSYGSRGQPVAQMHSKAAWNHGKTDQPKIPPLKKRKIILCS